MRMRRFVVPFVVLSTLLACTRPANSQLRNHDAFFGYSRTGSDAFYTGTGGLNGWEAALQIHLHPFFGAEGDVAHYGLGAAASIPRTTTVLAGPRVSVKALGINLFVHGLVGGEHSANGDSSVSGGSLAYAVGGGADLPIAPFFAWRFSADRLSAPTLSPATGDKARFNTGLVFRF
jgi:hypothetical protein